MSARVAVITGANRGIGRATARGLARAGFETVVLCRTLDRAQAAADELETESRLDRFRPESADLTRPDEIQEATGRLLARYQQIHLLVNNAGIVARTRDTTAEGFERTLAVNHLAPVRLTLGLLPGLLKSRGARVVNVASAAHDGAFDPSVFEGSGAFGSRKAYRQTKLLNFIFSFDTADRLQGAGVSVNAVHPGVVATSLLDDFVGGGALGAPMRGLARILGMSPEKGARTTLRVATDPTLTGVSGRYFRSRREATPPDAAVDKEVRERARRWTAELIGVDWGEEITRLRAAVG